MKNFLVGFSFLMLIIAGGRIVAAPPPPLTVEQFRLQQEFDSSSKKEGWTFSYNVRNVGRWGTGYVAPKEVLGPIYVLGADQKLKSFNLSEFGKALTPTMDQGSCGSCVIFSVTLNFQNALLLRGVVFPALSPQHLMNCGTGGQCNGAEGEGVSQDLVNLKGLHSETDYPYTASSGRCKSVSGPLYGQIKGYQTIDGSVRSILAALHNGQPISVGVAADSRWGSYSSGVYNACGSMSTNHYVDIEGVDCGTSVDADGNCVFDAKGNLPPGVGTFDIHNSWSNDFGVKGHMTSVITNKSGQRCNNIAGGQGNAQILDTGLPMPVDGPQSFSVDSKSVKLQVTVKPGGKAQPAQVKAALQNAIDTVGDK